MSPLSVHAASDAALETLFLPFEQGYLEWPSGGRCVFLRAREGAWRYRWCEPLPACEQSFKPHADALQQAGVTVQASLPEAPADCVLVLPPRQRDEARALLARAVRMAGPKGRVVACQSNAEGARSGQADLARLVGPVGSLSKHKCRVYWSDALDMAAVDPARVADWLALDALRPVGREGLISRPGLFAWDRVDAASALLAEHLPPDLKGRAADLGAGYGYLATRLLAQCPGITALDLYEAEARALEPARLNAERANAERAAPVPLEVHWHDVTTGLAQQYDVLVSNPPFHVDRRDLPALGRAFIGAAARSLTPRGRLWMVANRHLPYEATLQERFAGVRVVAERHGFKVFEAGRARR